MKMGIGDWGLGIGPNPQSPIPNPQNSILNIITITNQMQKVKNNKKIINLMLTYFNI